MQHIPSLDGIRALAVTLVFVAHTGLEHIVPGGLGVTIFFFLSGYLITTLLREEYERTGTISLKQFYLRRIYRIFPPMYVVLAVVLALSIAGVVNESRPIQMAPLLAQVFYVANYYAIANGESSFIAGTGVLWSLAIEEHYYLLFPLLLLALLRKFDRTKSAIILLALCAAVLAWRLVLVHGLNVSRTYTYLATDARLDSLLWGCILGLVFNPHLDRSNFTPCGGRWSYAVMAGAIAILMLCLLYRDPSFRETWRYTLQGVALFPLFYLAVKRSDWPVFRPLNWWPVRWLGRLSYTVYLFHLTGLTLASKIVQTGILRDVIGAVITIGFSLLMYLLVEKHFSNLRRQLHRQKILA